MHKLYLRIYYKELDANGNEINRGIDEKEYINYGSAVNRARKLYGDRNRFEYEIAWRDPWIDYTKTTICKCCGELYERTVTHQNWDCSHNIFLYKRDNRRESISGYICPDCYEKIKGFISSLKKNENNEVGM